MVDAMEIPKGFKKTEVGIIPSDWDILQLGNLFEITSSKRVFQNEWKSSGVPFYRARELAVLSEKGAVDNELFITKEQYNAFKRKHGVPIVGDMLVTGVGTLGKVYVVPDEKEFYFKDGNIIWFKIRDTINSEYLRQLYFTQTIIKQIDDAAGKTTVGTYTITGAKKTSIPCPPTKAEQAAIANALNDADALITELEKLIAKKKAIKQGAMQELLKPKEGWEAKTIKDLTDCLDNLRVPLNEAQRLTMKGDYPYCGANGILDFINDFRVDDEVILIAEDGGYFDEYATRPIAYKMSGKFWVNNHAHILKAKLNFDQDFIYYSLVHKNILNFLASGTRAKLNKSQMYKIEIHCPNKKIEQSRIAQILSDMDTEIEALEKKLDKYKMLKQGMMQNLLTGKIRLI